MKYREFDRFYYRVLLFFLTGFFLGLLLIYLGKNVLVENTDFLDENYLQSLRTLKADRCRLFLYSMRIRGMPAGILIALACIGYGSAGVCLYLIWSGFGVGTLLSVFSLRFGIRGVILFAGGLLPQMILLLPACMMLFRWCVAERSRKTTVASLRELILPILLLLGGCVLEGFLNTGMMELLFCYL